MSWYSSTSTWSNSDATTDRASVCISKACQYNSRSSKSSTACSRLRSVYEVKIVETPSASSMHHGKSDSSTSASFVARVDHARVDSHQRLLFWETLRTTSELELVPEKVHEVGGVGLVHHSEIRRKSEGVAIGAQQTVAHRVKGSPPHPPGCALARHTAGTLEHLLRRPPREGEQEYSLGSNSPLDEMGDPRGQRLGLASPGPRYHEQRARSVLRGGTLLRVQLGKVGGLCLDCGIEHAFEPKTVGDPNSGFDHMISYNLIRPIN